MTHGYSRRWLIVLFAVFLMLALWAYPSQAADATPTVTAGGTTSTPHKFFGPGSFKLPETTVGLSTLSSYRATLKRSFKGTLGGQPKDWSQTDVMVVSQKPSARQMTSVTSGDTSEQVFMAEMNGTLYEQYGNEACTAAVTEEGHSLAEKGELAALLSGVIGAEEAGEETVNGVAAKHYTFDERAIGLRGVAQSTGEVWIASEGAYIVKYMLVTKGSADYFGEGGEGTATWDYALSDINQPVTVNLPEDCPGGMVDAPVLPDATNVLKAPGVLSYTTVTSLVDVVAFYQKQLPASGWEVRTPPIINEDTAILNFSQGAQEMSVIVKVDGADTTVSIVLGAIFHPKATNTPTKVPSRTPAPTRTKPPTRTPAPTKTPKP